MSRAILADARRMSDRERILSYVAMVGAGPFQAFTAATPEPPDFYGWSTTIRPGDLVKCVTQRVPNRWNIAWYVGPSPRVDSCGSAIHLLRELGGEGLCHMSNESLYSLRGGSPYLLEGQQWRAYLAVAEAFRRIDHYGAKFHELRFPDRYATSGEIVVRPHVFSSAKEGATLAIVVPFAFDRRTSGKQVRAAIEAATDGVKWSERAVAKTSPNSWMAVPPPAWSTP